jgi:sugar lactone lactonase YvrE
VHLSSLEHRSLDIPDAAGLALSQDGLWLADWDKGLILKDVKDLATLRIFGAAGGEPFKPAAVSATDEGAWVLDMAQLRFIRKDLNGKTLESVKTPGPAPQGVCWDGYNLWSFDAATGLLYRYGLDPRSGVEASFALPGMKDLASMQWAGAELWTLDSKNRLARYAMKNGAFVRISSQILKSPAAAFWTGGGYLWTLEKPRTMAGAELVKYKVKVY